MIDASVAIGLERLAPEALPEQLAIAAITLDELAACPHATVEADALNSRELVSPAAFGSAREAVLLAYAAAGRHRA